ncbi:MAG: helix-turn-helix domain-containing protein [Candidatus Bathyarchaeia archaeon]
MVTSQYCCSDCGNVLSAGSNFCDRCGISVTGSLWAIVLKLEEQVNELEKARAVKKRRARAPRKRVEIPQDRLLELHKKGLNDREIAKELHVPPSSVYRMRRKLGLPANAPRGFPEYVLGKKSSGEKSQQTPV